jgi:hypothetical protein
MGEHAASEATRPRPESPAREHPFVGVGHEHLDLEQPGQKVGVGRRRGGGVGEREGRARGEEAAREQCAGE